ncbi:MAG: hypothetical protein AUI47_03400, partial [Acidobacteria bacterium 13_1_40CM_2_68_5]
MGFAHSLVVKPDGSTWAWGYNGDGELGNGGTTSSASPVQVTGLTSTVAVSAGFAHSLALKSDGTVWGWGYNGDGELGTGSASVTPVTAPVQAVNLTNAVAVVAGNWHSLALKKDGTVWAWGYNDSGQLGNGTTSTNPTSTPVQVSDLIGIVAIAAGGYHSLALKADGSVWAWGDDTSGQLGNGSTANASRPVRVSGISAATAIAAGGYHSLALANGGLYSWGNDYYGQLGDGGYYDSAMPLRIQAGTSITRIVAGEFQSMAIAGATGGILQWGYNYPNSVAPSTTLTNVMAIAAGGRQSMALEASGQISQWGLTIAKTPVAVPGAPSNISLIASGGFHDLVLQQGSSYPYTTVWAWGFNGDGQLGNGSLLGSATPMTVGWPPTASILAAGRYFSLVGSGISVYGWGDDFRGQLGFLGEPRYATPQIGPIFQFNIRRLAAGGYHAIGVDDGQAIKAWGDDTYGQIGNGTVSSSPSRPVPVTWTVPPAMPAVLGAGLYHSLGAVRSDSYSWGRNADGQLGDGTTTDRSSPVPVQGAPAPALPFQQPTLAAGAYHSLEVDNNTGNLYAWGYNGDGELGNGTTTRALSATQVPGFTAGGPVAAGDFHSVARKTDGTVWAWGANDFGQLGNGTTTRSTTPVQVTGLTNIVQVSAGGVHTVALKSDGTLWQWGAIYNPTAQGVLSIAGVPGQTLNAVAIAGEGSATVSWSPPAACTSVSSYTIASQPPGSTVTVSGSTFSAVATGLTDGTSYRFTVTATNAAGDGPGSAPSNSVVVGRGAYVPVTPTRILDTRSGLGTGRAVPLGEHETMNVPITGQGGLPPTGVSAVVINVTVTNTTAGSYLTVWPAGVPRPTASNLNWTAGKTVPNLVEVAVGVEGKVSIFNALGSTNVIFDVAGYVASPMEPPGVDGRYTPVVPQRVLDTRTGAGGVPVRAVGPGGTVSVRMNGQAGLPQTGVAAVVLNVTVTGPTAPSYLTVYPTGNIQPIVSNLNFVAGQTVPNRVIVKVGNSGSTQVIADIGGWFSDGTNPAATGSRFVGVTPARILDTRDGTGGVHAPIGPGGTIAATVAGVGGVPAMNATVAPSAVVLNVTVTDTTGQSYLTVWPDGATRPNASDL